MDLHRKHIGILAYGSLINNPGKEIDALVEHRFTTQTPFPVEFARISGGRGGAPTVVPHKLGATVNAEVLVLSAEVSMSHAKDILYRREINQVDSGREYLKKTGANAVVVQEKAGYCELLSVLYTDFNSEGKIDVPIAKELAKFAVESVAKTSEGRDGISYLIDLLEIGVKTPLSGEYEKEVLKLSACGNLSEALQKLTKLQPRPVVLEGNN